MNDYPKYFDLTPFQENGKWGFKNDNNKVVFPAQFDDEGVYPINGPYAIVSLMGAYGLIDMYGKFIFPPKYKTYDANGYEAGAWNEAVPIKFDGKYGYISYDEKVIIQPSFKEAKQFSEGRAAIQKNGKWGYIDETGEIVIKCKYSIANEFKNGFARVKLPVPDGTNKGIFDDSVHYIDKYGKTLPEVIPFESAYDFSEGMARVRVIKSSTKYNPHLFAYKENRRSFEAIEELDVPDPNGYERIWNYKYGYGFINEIGELIVKFLYDSATDFRYGVAGVKKDGKWAMINNSGKLISSFLFDDFQFTRYDGYCIVATDKLYGIINNQGSMIVECLYDEIKHPYTPRREHSLFLSLHDKWGVYSLLQQKEIIPCEYDEVRPEGKGYIAFIEEHEVHFDEYGNIFE